MSSDDFLLGATAARQLLALPPEDQGSAMRALEIMAAHTFTSGLPQWTGSDGRTHYLRFIHGWAITFWVDHSERKVRITEITMP